MRRITGGAGVEGDGRRGHDPALRGAEGDRADAQWASLRGAEGDGRAIGDRPYGVRGIVGGAE